MVFDWPSVFFYFEGIIALLLGVYGLYRLSLYWLKKNWGDVDRENEVDAKGKIVIVTGASAGIGKETAKGLAERGANVILACRTVSKAEQVVQEIRTKTKNGELTVMELDLASLESVQRFAKEFKAKYPRLDILINNAGIVNSWDLRRVTKDGFEEQFGTNHLGHFLLTNLLLEDLKKAKDSRIVIVSSGAHISGKLNFDDLTHENCAHPKTHFGFLSGYYCNSKLANNLFNIELAKRLKGTGINTYCLCPGLVSTDIFGKECRVGINHLIIRFISLWAKNSEEGAATTLYCALSKSVANHSGEMYRNCEFWDQRRRTKLSEKDAERLWLESEKLVGLQK